MKAQDYGLTKQDIIEMSNKYMWDIGYRFPIVVEEAKDTMVKDVDGDEYLDFYAGIAVNSAGNCNEKVVKAVQEQAADAYPPPPYGAPDGWRPDLPYGIK